MSTAVIVEEYKNDFFALRIRKLTDTTASYVFESGLSLPRFNPIIWGRTGICSNAAFKALQQLRADVSRFAQERGVLVQTAPEQHERKNSTSHGWYQEKPLLLQNASPDFVAELIRFGAQTLIQTIVTAARQDVTAPPGTLEPASAQHFLESLEVPNYREAAPPPIAKQQAA